MSEDNDENVELEKSNVLLMGPTGSGFYIAVLFISFLSIAIELELIMWRYVITIL